MRIGKIAVLSLVAGGLLAAQSYNEQLERSRSLLAGRQFRDAQAAAERAIQSDPNRWEAYVLAANAYSSLGLFDDAIGLLQLALPRAPEEKKPLIREALTEARRGAAAPPSTKPAGTTAAPPNPTMAEIVLWKSIEANPTEVDLNTYLRTYPNGAFVPLAKARLGELIKVRSAHTAAIDSMQGIFGCNSKNNFGNYRTFVKVLHVEPLEFGGLDYSVGSDVWPAPGAPPLVVNKTDGTATRSCRWTSTSELLCTENAHYRASEPLRELARIAGNPPPPDQDWKTIVALSPRSFRMTQTQETSSEYNGEYVCSQTTMTQAQLEIAALREKALAASRELQTYLRSNAYPPPREPSGGPAAKKKKKEPAPASPSQPLSSLTVEHCKMRLTPSDEEKNLEANGKNYKARKEGTGSPEHWVFIPNSYQELHLFVTDQGTRILGLYEAAAHACQALLFVGAQI